MILNRGIGSDDSGGDRGPRQEPVNGTVTPSPSPDRTAPLELPFAIGDLARLRLLVTRRAEDAGLCEPRLSDFVLAVHEVASNAIVHGGGKGRIHLDHTDEGLHCVIADSGPGLPPKDTDTDTNTGFANDIDIDDEAESGRGLWLAQALTDRFDIAVCDAGTTITLVALLS